MFFRPRPELPLNITSYDLLKFLTILTMVADHLGAYIYYGEPWLRVVGRWGFMVWFFLAGYAHTRALSKELIAGMLIIVGMNVVAGLPLLPLSALGSIVAIRLLIDPLAKLAFRSWEILLYVSVIAICAAYPTGYLFEYGSLALLTGLFGYALRHQDEINLSRRGIVTFGVSVVAILIGYEIFTMPFTIVQAIACSAGMLLVGGALFAFRPAQYPTLTQRLPPPLVKVIQWGGRYSLEIYVIHLAILKVLGFILGTKAGELFMPTLFMDV